jgi:hypothetical protein
MLILKDYLPIKESTYIGKDFEIEAKIIFNNIKVLTT